MPPFTSLGASLDLSQFNGAVNQFVAGIDKMNSATSGLVAGSGLVQTYNNAMDSLGQTIDRVVNIAGGVLIRDAIRALGSEIRDLGGEAIDAASQFQQLTIQFQTLAARDVTRVVGGTMADAYAQSSKAAQDLLGWVRALSVETPFTITTLSSAMAMAQGFGLNVSGAKALTVAIGDMTSALGLFGGVYGETMMQRIMYHFGQMESLGTVTGRDLLYLSREFIPVNDILRKVAETTGETFQQVKADISAGTLSATTFMQAFVDYVDTNYAGSMQRMSKTWSGVKNNINDFIQSVLGLEVLGPVMTDISAKMADLLEHVFTVDFLRQFVVFGQTLQRVFEILYGAFGDLGKSIGTFFADLDIGLPTAYDTASVFFYIAYAIEYCMDSIGAGIVWIGGQISAWLSSINTSMDDLKNNALTWGENIIIAFAKGMAQAIIYVIDTITWIAEAIAGLLESHSPPKILPDLETWGQNAINTWLKGWTEGNFGVLDVIGNEITRLLSSFQEMSGKVDTLSLQNLRILLGNAVEEFSTLGAVSQDTLDQISSMFQVDGDLVSQYVTQMLALTEATQREKDAQAELDAITKKYSDQLSDLNNELKDLQSTYDYDNNIKKINQALGSNILTAEERARLEQEKHIDTIKRQISQTEIAKSKDEKAAKEKVDQAKEIEDALKSQTNVLKALIDFQIKNFELMKLPTGKPEAFDLPQIDITGTLDQAILDLEDEKSKISTALDGLQTEIGARVKELFDKILAPFNEISAHFAPLVSSFNRIWNDLSPSLTKFWNETLHPFLIGFKKWWDSVDWSQVLGILGSLAVVAGIVILAFSGLTSIDILPLIAIVQAIVSLGATLVFVGGILPEIASVVAIGIGVVIAAGAIFLAILAGIAFVIYGLITNIGNFRDILQTSFGAAIDAIKIPLSELFTQVKFLWDTISKDLFGDDTKGKAIDFKTIITDVFGGVAVAIGAVIGFIAGLIAGFISAFTTIVYTFTNIYQDVTVFGLGIVIQINGIIDLIKSAFTIGLQFVRDLFSGNWDGVRKDLDAWIATLEKDIPKIFKGVLLAFGAVWDGIANLLYGTFAMVWNFFAGFVDGIVDYINVILVALGQVPISKDLAKIPNPSQLFGRSEGSDAGNGMVWHHNGTDWVKVPGHSTGGSISNQGSFAINENPATSPEIIVLAQNSGYVLTRQDAMSALGSLDIGSFMTRMVAGSSIGTGSRSSVSHSTKTVNINVNASYSTPQSPMAVKHDVMAALAYSNI